MDPYKINILSMSKDHSLLPTITYTDIYNYLVHTVSPYISQKPRVFKLLESIFLSLSFAICELPVEYENKMSPFLVLFGAVGLVWGYTIQQFSQTVYILGAGLLLASLLTIPPWGIFRYSEKAAKAITIK